MQVFRPLACQEGVSRRDTWRHRQRRQELLDARAAMPVPDPSPLADKYSEAVLALWGESDEEATKKFKKGFKKLDVPSGKGYLRLTDDPSKEEQ